MSPLAEVVQGLGYYVTGSDVQESVALTRLRDIGISVQVGHEPQYVKSAQIIVYSSAVREDNPELLCARVGNGAVMKRAVMLGDLMRRSFSIGIAGTHGKTTTSAMVAGILRQAKMNPTVIVGGVFCDQAQKRSPASTGESGLLVVEADEYDRSFLQMYPSVAVVTNIEEDHLDIYKDLDDICDAFTEYVNRVPFFGEAVLCADDSGVQRIFYLLVIFVIT